MRTAMLIGWIAACGTAFGQIACEQARLQAADGVDFDQFGSAVALSCDVGVVGAYAVEDHGFFSGAVYVFRRDGAGWVQEEKVYAPAPVESDYFGASVAVSGDVLAVGAPGAFPSFASGRVNVYTFDGAAWRQGQALGGSAAGAAARFGSALAFDGRRLVVGSREDYYSVDRGRAYVFEIDPEHPDVGWAEAAVLSASDGEGQDRFGSAVAMSGDVIIVGAPRHNNDAGAAYVFRRSPDGVWVEEQKFTASQGALAGSAVAVWGDVAVVGRPGGTGRADIYRYQGGQWVFEHFVNTGGNSFGWAVACEGDVVVVGGRSDPLYGFQHAARVYRYQGGSWSHTDRLRLPAQLVDTNDFSKALAMTGNTVLVGAARYGETWQHRPGAAFVFGLNGCEHCPADFDGNGVVNTLDVLAFLNAFVAGEPRADFNCDGVVNTLDVLAFLTAWAGGC